MVWTGPKASLFNEPNPLPQTSNLSENTESYDNETNVKGLSLEEAKLLWTSRHKQNTYDSWVSPPLPPPQTSHHLRISTQEKATLQRTWAKRVKVLFLISLTSDNRKHNRRTGMKECIHSHTLQTHTHTLSTAQSPRKSTTLVNSSSWRSLAMCKMNTDLAMGTMQMYKKA